MTGLGRRAISIRSTIPTRRRRGRSTGGRSGTIWRVLGWTRGGWMPPSPIFTPTSISRSSKRRIGPTALGPGAAFYNSYPLLHTSAVYQGARAMGDTRAFILTRSAFAGQQRNAAATWSGDVPSRWEDLRRQISAGVNFSMSGIPNWTFDIGGFALEKRYLHPSPADLAEWRELNTRWFQFGALVPLFRSHGEEPYREIFNLAPEGSDDLSHSGVVRRAALSAAALYLYAGGGHVSSGRHDHAGPGDGLPAVTARCWASMMSICSGRPCWSALFTSTGLENGRSICRRAPGGTTSIMARCSREGRPSTRRRRWSACPCS